MNPIYIFDLSFFIAFCIGTALFLYKHKKRVTVESKIFLMYRTKRGLNFMDKISKKFPKLLSFLSYASISFGYIALIGILLLLFQSIKVMLSLRVVPKMPPLMPLVPYLPQMFKLPLPPFYFTYWIIIILIIAVTHEFAHGIFARHFKIKVKSTGFGFLGPFLAAFVEPDEKAMNKKSKKAQLSVLSGGSFSNFMFAILFLLVLQAFFLGCYEKAGVTGYMYSFEKLNLTSINKIGNYTLDEFLNEKITINNLTSNGALNNTLIPVQAKNRTYYLKSELYPLFEKAKEENKGMVVLYQDEPAIKNNLSGAIQYIDNKKVNKLGDIQKILSAYKPNDTITVQTNIKNYSITLDKNPNNNSRAYLGILFPKFSGATAYFSKLMAPFFSPFTYAEPRFNKEVLKFIKDLLFWLILIAFSVALINMLPLGALDGGRFLYITIWGLTKSKKKAEKGFRAASLIVILILLALMLVWMVKL